MGSDEISLELGTDGPSNYRHDEKGRPQFGLLFFHILEGDAVNRGEHQRHAPGDADERDHPDIAGEENGTENEEKPAESKSGEEFSGTDEPEEPGADEAAAHEENHGGDVPFLGGGETQADFLHSVVDDVGPAHDLCTDVEGLGNDSSCEVGPAKDAAGDAEKGSVLLLGFEGRHLCEEKEHDEDDNDGSNDKVRGADVGEILGLEFLEAFGIGCVVTFEGVGSGPGEDAGKFIGKGGNLLIERDFDLSGKGDGSPLESGSFGEGAVGREKILGVFGVVLSEFSGEFGRFESGCQIEGGNGHAGEGTDGIEGLSKVETAGCRFARSHGKDVGVACGLKEGEATGNDVGTQDEDGKGDREAGRNGEKGSESVKGEADNDGSFVRESPDEECGREGHAEVAEVEGELEPGRLSRRDDEDLLVDFDERIGVVVGKSPEGKTTCGEDECGQISGRNDSGRR